MEDNDAISIPGQIFVVRNFDQRITRPEFDEKMSDIQSLIAKIKQVDLNANQVSDTGIMVKENSVKFDEKKEDETKVEAQKADEIKEE